MLTRGFRAWRKRAFWDEALTRLADRASPPGLPRLGYLLEVDGTVAGALLLIASEAADGTRYCNVSSWYVEPRYRLYGALLVRRAFRHRDVTFLNVTPAPETRSLLAAQGYRSYAGGRSFTLPALARRGAAGAVSRVRGAVECGPDLSAHEATLLGDHDRWGCISLVVAADSGRLPFIFGLRRRHGLIPFAYLLHCRDLDGYCAYARAIGLHLLRYGVAVVVIDTEARLAGVPGWFRTGFPKFYRGAGPPSAHDLAYTERAVFGV